MTGGWRELRDLYRTEFVWLGKLKMKEQGELVIITGGREVHEILCWRK